MNVIDFEFLPPPEAPVFEPTAEEFKDPLAYIAKIRPIAEKTGICKIKPPPEWCPPFAVDVDNFRFTPRMQRLNELEATTRVKLNFLDQIAKFWELQGSSLKIPNVERKALDLFTLYRVVLEEGGSDIVSRERRWSRIATRMGYPPGRGVGSLLRQHYERILYPYHVFQEGTTLGDIRLEEEEDCEEDKDYVPHGIPSRQAIRPPADRYARRSKRCKEEEHLDGIDYSCNNELKKLQFYGAGPKMPGFPAQGGGGHQQLEEAFLKENHFECFKDLKMGLGAKDLKMGFGTNKQQGSFLKETKTIGAVEAARLGNLLLKRREGRPKGSMTIDQMVCTVCSRGDEEASMLLCDGCDDSYHTFCLIPPLNEIPKGDWRCPCCVAKEVNKPQEAFGFEQAQREYTLQEFGQKADEFKTSYFNMPVHRVPYSLVEKEFWRIVNAVDEDVTVEYGADLHTIEHGSGFPNTKTNALMLPGDEEYVTSGWNLNNLPVLEGSVLRHINADISGMKIPWTYVGMCFATFCWHNEDHWSYSINYLHWGEPKTWYGVPGGKAESFEEAMRSVAPELFSTQPDLLHQLVTIMNPNLLSSQGVPICRTNQQAGEFVITFPRSYHAGFNQGYNFAEAVNFAPADWLPIGRVCVSHYGMLHRFCVFSHDELVCKMASDPERLDVSVAASTYQDMLRMVEAEREARRGLLEWGVTQANREVFELLPDDERQCDYCKTTCFLSAVTCSCTNNGLVCISHRDKLCACPPEKHCLLYRYTLDELPSMLYRLKARAESFDCWSLKVQQAMEATPDNKLSLCSFRDLVAECEEKGFPSSSSLYESLCAAVEEGEKCTLLSQQLLNRRGRTRTRQSGGEVKNRLTLEDLQLFHQQLATLACEIKEAALVKDLLDRAITFQQEARSVLMDERPDSRRLEKCLETGIQLDIDVAEIPQLKQKLDQCRWLEDVRCALGGEGRVTLGVLRGLLDGGVNVPPHPATEKVMAELQEMLTFGERWEEKARGCLHARPKLPLSALEGVVRDASTISVHLPNVMQLTDAVRKARDWIKKVQAIQGGNHNPYLDMLEKLVSMGQNLPVRLDQLPNMEQQAEMARTWREKTQRTFLLKRTSYTLTEVLTPRKDIGAPPSKGKKKRNDETKEEETLTEENREPAVIVATFKEAERREMEAIMLLRAKNERKHSEEDARFCICNKPPSTNMVQCQLCRDCFHVSCLPSKVVGRVSFLCPGCVRSRRPRLETILSLLMALQKIPVRLTEGEALQCLTERGMSWQDRAKQLLKMDEVTDALRSLQQQKNNQIYSEKSENIVNAELDKHLLKTAAWKNSNTPVEPEVKLEVKPPLTATPQDSIKQEIETVDLTGEAASHSTEHAYSSASKAQQASSTVAVPARKHCRKSPLLPRQMMDPSPSVRMSEETRKLLEQLQIEGDLLEMTLDESHDINKLVQATMMQLPLQCSFASNPSPFSDCEDTTPIVRIEKKKAKRQKVEGTTKSIFMKSKPHSSKQQGVSRSKKKGEIHFRKEMKDGSVRTVRAKLFAPRRTKKSSEDKEMCSANSCLRPIGDSVNWVQCDGGCEQWFHLLCVGLDLTEVSETEDYICTRCSSSGGQRRVASSPTHDSEDVAVSVLAGFASLATHKES